MLCGCFVNKVKALPSVLTVNCGPGPLDLLSFPELSSLPLRQSFDPLQEDIESPVGERPPQGVGHTVTWLKEVASVPSCWVFPSPLLLPAFSLHQEQLLASVRSHSRGAQQTPGGEIELKTKSPANSEKLPTKGGEKEKFFVFYFCLNQISGKADRNAHKRLGKQEEVPGRQRPHPVTQPRRPDTACHQTERNSSSSKRTPRWHHL